ncbi:MAG: putative motility protein [Devosiaceae bacterium]|nr:putative motility protein [Devosiaceae bacterium]
MNLDIASQAFNLKQVQTQASAQFAVIKKQQEMDKMLIEMVDAVSKSAPLPPGMGTRVDKTA